MTDYDAENEFENYLCFSAILSERLKTATEELDALNEHDSPEYVRAVVDKVMKPLCDVMKYKIRAYPYTLENLPSITEICGEQTAEFILAQKELFEEYYTLLPVIKPQKEVQTTWAEIEQFFEEVLTHI